MENAKKERSMHLTNKILNNNNQIDLVTKVRQILKPVLLEEKNQIIEIWWKKWWRKWWTLADKADLHKADKRNLQWEKVKRDLQWEEVKKDLLWEAVKMDNLKS